MITPLNMLLAIPELPYAATTTPGLLAAGAQTLLAHWFGMLIPINKAGDISRVRFVMPNSNAGNVYDVRVESVDADGKPSGSLWTTGTEKTGLTGIGNGTVMDVALDAAATVAVGDYIAVVIKSTTFVGNWTVAGFEDVGAGYVTPGIVRTTNSGSTWAINGYSPVVGLEYSDGSFPRILNVFPISACPATTLTAASTPRIAGNRITPTVGLRVTGIWWWADIDGADARLRLYGPDGTTVLWTADFDKDIPIATGIASVNTIPLASPITLEAGQSYYLMLEALGTSTILYDLQSFNAQALLALNAGAVAQRATAASNAPTGHSDFTIDTDRMSLCGVIFDGIDIPAAAAGETAHTFLS